MSILCCVLEFVIPKNTPIPSLSLPKKYNYLSWHIHYSITRFVYSNVLSRIKSLIFARKSVCILDVKLICYFPPQYLVHLLSFRSFIHIKAFERLKKCVFLDSTTSLQWWVSFSYPEKYNYLSWFIVSGVKSQYLCPKKCVIFWHN